MIEIDDLGRLCICPEKEEFTLIFRTATEVHWDGKGRFLYSPKPQEWSYFEWYKHITSVVMEEFNCELLLNSNTRFDNLPENLLNQILLK
ncbi:hypothetical protein [Mucilaginibacter sp.]|uniref:hypothetical protein n=1 Tax=Mucilaginibacter sp. TaxID=1882438 RepID=UPI0025CB7A43|nr:hypothetical protein [Mucilaginibacter sp.]